MHKLYCFENAHQKNMPFWNYQFDKVIKHKLCYQEAHLLYHICVNVSKPTHVQYVRSGILFCFSLFFFSPQYKNMHACTCALYTGLLDIWEVLETAAKSALSLTQKMCGTLWTEHLAELVYWWMSVCISAWQCLNMWGTAAYVWNYSQCNDVILAAPQPKVWINIAMKKKKTKINLQESVPIFFFIRVLFLYLVRCFVVYCLHRNIGPINVQSHY